GCALVGPTHGHGDLPGTPCRLRSARRAGPPGAADAGGHGTGPARCIVRGPFRGPETVRSQASTEATSFARPDLRFAAWFWWMTPLEAALSSLREATFSALSAASASPAETAVRTLRTWVLSSDFTARLRSRAFSFVLFRLIWDLMFATKTLL